MMILRILEVILPVFLIIGVGYIYGRWMRPEMTAINRLVMNVFAPALIFVALADAHFDLSGNGRLILCGIAVVLGSGLLALPFVRWLGADPRTFLPPIMFNNCGIIGIPLALLAFDEPGLSAMVALFSISQLLQFTLGVAIVRQYTPLQFLRLPMLHATWLGLVCALFRWSVAEPFLSGLKMIGYAAIPLMLFSLGIRLLHASWGSWKLGAMGGIVCPTAGIAVALGLTSVLDLNKTQNGLLLLFGSLPPAVMSFMIAEKYNQEPDKVASIVSVGTLFSIVFIPLALLLAFRS